MNTALRVISYIFVFYAGRLSYNLWRNRYLEEKRGELIAYHKALLDISDGLERKDQEIRKKWQTMVDDVSKYQSMVGGFETGKWTDMDDVYLNSWKSAEE